MGFDLAWDRGKARAALSALPLAAANREVADYWLSLWLDGQPPTREQFKPAPIRRHLSSMAVFEVMPEGPVICRLAGLFVQAAIGSDLTGKDLLDFTPAHQRETRIKNTRAIVDGAVSFAIRHFTFQGQVTHAGEIALPFSGTTENGGRRYLLHSEWSPRHFARIGQMKQITDAGLATDQRLISITTSTD